MIPFNKPPYTGNEEKYVIAAMRSCKISGNGEFSKRCQIWFEKNLGCHKAFLTPSCTHALEMAAILLNIQPSDEIIMPSYTFISTANAFALRGAKIVFVDIRPDTMNIDENKIEAAITSKTKAIVPVHYAGVGCEMEKIMKLSDKYSLFIVEDAALGMMSTYKGKPLGTIGHFGAYSFHETKNFTSAGEGGLLIVNDKQYSERAEIIRDKGTNRSQFISGKVDKYSWVDIGSSFLLNDVSTAYLWGLLEKADDIQENRLKSWNMYYNGFQELAAKKYIELPQIPNSCTHNGNIFYIKVKDENERNSLSNYLFQHEINVVSHYVPLHSSIAGLKYGRFSGEENYTTIESERLLRLPLYFGLSENEILYIIEMVKNYYLEYY